MKINQNNHILKYKGLCDILSILRKMSLKIENI